MQQHPQQQHQPQHIQQQSTFHDTTKSLNTPQLNNNFSASLLPSSSSTATASNCSIFIANLPLDADVIAVKELFSRFGIYLSIIPLLFDLILLSFHL
jgi:RNA recognition motif-containing protein